MDTSKHIINECDEQNHLVFRFVPTMRCNFRCSYCFLKHSDGQEPTMFDNIPVSQWIYGIKNFSDYELDIYMWGGEPFCIEPTYELVRELDKLDFVKWMRIDTNLSYARKILKRCPSSKVRLNCSWHTEVFDYTTVKKHITELHKRNMVGMLNFVASDVNLAYLERHSLELDEIVRDFWDKGVYMNVAADFNKGNDQDYFKFITRYTTVEDWKNIHGDYPSKGVDCDAGNHFYTIEHDGSLTCCGRVKQMLDGQKGLETVGNLFSGDLLRRQARCPHNKCLSLVSYCHRMDNSFSCQQHLDDYVRRNIAHRKRTGILDSPQTQDILVETIPSAEKIIQDKPTLLPILDSTELFKEAQAQFELGNAVTAQRLIAQYNKTMDYNSLEGMRRPSREMPPLLSVVLVTYNRPDDVAKCVNALREQQYQDFELIIVDNGDADRKATALIDVVDVYVNCPINFNLSEGRNIGAHFASGQILVMLDDDALVGPEYLSSIRNAFKQYEILGLRGRSFPKNGQPSDERVGVYDLGEQPYATMCNQEGNSAFRRDAYISVGGMDPLLFGHEGTDLTYRLMQLYDCPSGVLYWPETIIYHDYGDAAKHDEKRKRYKRNREYLKHKYNLDVVGLKDKISQNALCANQSGRLLPPVPLAQPSETLCQTNVDSETNDPKVSIVMSCHNAANFLAETVDTILSQSLKDWELLVTDDASTDQTRMILESYAAKDSRIRLWYFDDQKGPYARRNFAIKQAKAPFICIHDADDLMAPQKLDILYEAICQDNRLGIVGSHYRRFYEIFRGAEFGDRMEKRITHSELMEAFPGNWHLCWHGSAIIRKTLFETIGLYDEQPYGSDTFWLSKAGLFGLLTGKVQFKNLPEFLTFKREHAQSQTGKLSPADPRNRRHQLERYYLQKLQQIYTQAKVNPSMDIASVLKECTCTDFIPKYKHLFQSWESASVNDTMVQGLINRGLAQFAAEQYVSSLITLNALDQMIPGASQSCQNLNFTRGLAYYASGDDYRAVENIQNEIRLFKSQNAKAFLTRYLSNGSQGLSAADRRANIHSFIAETSGNKSSSSYSVPAQGTTSGGFNGLQEKLGLAKQYLSHGKTQEALGIYHELLTDKIVTQHVVLMDKLQKLVDGISAERTAQISLAREHRTLDNEKYLSI